MSTRLFRAGSSPASDRAIDIALQTWRALEERLGWALDHRTACGLLAEDAAVLAALREATPVGIDISEPSWAFNVLLDLLWATPESLRTHSLQVPRPFAAAPPSTERTLVLDAIEEETKKISVHEDSWRTAADSLLATTGRCVLVGSADREDALRIALLDFMVEPIEVGSLHLHPRVTALRRRVQTVEVVLELVEAPQ
jgi:hypothetical protein